MKRLPSVTTLKKAALRALWAGVLGLLAGFVSTPINIDKPKQYLSVLLVAVVTGFLMGIQKFISGYIKYDKI